jgi:hypothetical protein
MRLRWRPLPKRPRPWPLWRAVLPLVMRTRRHRPVLRPAAAAQDRESFYSGTVKQRRTLNLCRDEMCTALCVCPLFLICVCVW